ncbi:hypothetical protein Tco_1287598, partial [Tanacetum coccineum]
LVTQPKAPTDLKTKKKIIPPSSKPKSPYKARVILLKKQVAETQHDEVTVATADATKSLVASELAKEQGNQPSATEVKKVLDFYQQLLKSSLRIFAASNLLKHHGQHFTATCVLTPERGELLKILMDLMSLYQLAINSGVANVWFINHGTLITISTLST